MRESYTLDQVVADALLERGFRFRERDHVGLRADPPVIRLQPRRDGVWLVLDVDEVMGTAEDLPKAKMRAGELLGRGGSIWVLGVDGLVQSVEEYIPHTIRATSLGPFPKERVGAIAPPSTVAAGAEQPVSTSDELEVSEPASATPAQLTAEAMRKMLGPAWVSSMHDARQQRDTEAMAEGLKEAYHVIHALHPLLPGIANVVQNLIRAARF
jgi:hypothetical protein